MFAVMFSRLVDSLVHALDAFLLTLLFEYDTINWKTRATPWCDSLNIKK